MGLRAKNAGDPPDLPACCFALAVGQCFVVACRATRRPALDVRAVLAPLFLLSLVLVNAQAVTAMTSERDARASTCCW